MSIETMISSHPHVRGNANQALIAAIEECLACAQTCAICADACLGEPMVADLTQCIRLDLDCADLCFATARIAARRTGSNEIVIRASLEACAQACRLCAEECETHAGHHDHCRLCAEACRRCEQACRSAAATVTPRLR